MTEPVPEVPPVATTGPVVEAISQQLGPDIPITQEQISLVLGAWNDVQQGAALGTLMRDPVTGAIAHRVSNDGRHLWRVSSPSGDRWDDLNPTLPGWDVISVPTV